MKRHGLSHDYYYRFYVGTNPINAPEAVNTNSAAEQLYARGYAATTHKLKRFVDQGLIDPSDKDHPQNASWTKERIDQAAKVFEDQQDFNFHAEYFRFHGLTLTYFYERLKTAHDNAVDEFGHAALSVLSTRPDPDHFRMILEPPIGNRKARISFDLQTEIQGRIEAKRKRK